MGSLCEDGIDTALAGRCQLLETPGYSRASSGARRGPKRRQGAALAYRGVAGVGFANDLRGGVCFHGSAGRADLAHDPGAGPAAGVAVGPMIIFDPAENIIKWVDTQFGSLDKAEIEHLHQVAKGKETATAEGPAVFQILKESVLI